MWRSKMAARLSGEDGHLNTGKSDFLLHNTSNEFVLNRSHVGGGNFDTPSCVDCSILAILEDSAVASESKNIVDEENETMLSALTEMLDRVEEDEDKSFSPFDVLPDSEFLSQTAYRNNNVSKDFSPSQRLRSRPKLPTTNGENYQGYKTEENSLPQMLKTQNQLFCTKNKKAEAKVEVFSSASILSLVNLMHPYCLKLHVEKEDKSRKKQFLFSQEEVWKYEQPTEESDEEINVVSDEEAPVKGTKEEDGLEAKGDKGRCLKSVLLNGNSSRAASTRERKRVSFGPVHVASFDESEEEGIGEKNQLSGDTNETKSESLTLELPTLTPDRKDNADVGQQSDKKGEPKVKSLSLQEYRQLRQNRRPLVEKPGDYMTKWPSVPETPKELTPIFGFQRQERNLCRPKTTHLDPDLHRSESSSHRASSLHPSESKRTSYPHRSRLKYSRAKSKMISPASPLPDNTANLNLVLIEGKKSPIKQQTLFNVDPPNPVLLSLPSNPASNSSSESRCLQEIQNDLSAAPSQAITLDTEPLVSSVNKEFTTTLSQESKASPTKMPPDVSSGSPVQTGSAPSSVKPPNSSPSHTNRVEPLPKGPQSSSPDPVKSIKCPTPPIETSMLVKEESPDVLQISSGEPSPPQTDCKELSAAVESGIEAFDLTSLLEQFEETQAVEDQTERTLIPGSLPSNLQTDDLKKPEAAGSERTSGFQLKPPVEPREPSRTSGSLLDQQTVEPVNIPEPLGTEIVVSSQQELLARRQRPPSKSIRIIDPRPLPARKTLMSPAETPPAHVFSYLPFDHDYCGSVGYPPAFQCSRAKPSPLEEMSKTPTEQQLETRDSNPPEESKKHASDEQTALQQQQPWTCSEALPFSDSAVTKGDNKTQNPPSILPTPPPSPPVRGRDKRRYRRRSPRSDSRSSSSSSSSSSSCSSCSPKRPRIHHRRSESSSCSSSCVSCSPPRRYRLSYSRFSRSRSRSWSRSRSPTPSWSPPPQIRRRLWREVRSSSESRRLRKEQEVMNQKLKAIDERRVVYVGRIRRTMTQDELSERFSQFGEVECVSLHFRDRGDHYGFVTFYNMEDAFAAIDNGGKLRKPDELPFDICFGGRRQFCSTDYADLDANRDADPSPSKSRFEDLDFDSLLKQAQRGQKR
ncbi:peroxisome proliferator-activated receptor gamma coactivator-related protein 1 [Nematolebias whitei]|uniref:peroxisome proliferator-activated receptor gamma coactivator-related protein 1 n=1 Tax=Nematolebias whitei TaxID=451745 RepID=UPI001896BB03|nr:peroxisome proliferator-activated receptor gamma coactivator-related protein 1 [Nematolebias whitei]